MHKMFGGRSNLAPPCPGNRLLFKHITDHLHRTFTLRPILIHSPFISAKHHHRDFLLLNPSPGMSCVPEALTHRLNSDSNPFLLIIIGVFTLISIRFLYVLNRTRKPMRRGSRRPVSTLIVLGSGGHTAEMLNLLTVLQKDRFSPRYYIAAATDNMSLQKARGFENSSNDEAEVETAQFMQIYRSREVGQSYVTSVGTTLVAIAHALWLIIKTRPQVVVGFKWSSIFYVESIARVRRLSLSGSLLYKLRIADQLYVQWPQLQQKYPRTIYVGCLM
ncbi:UDP-N-acetylglucosamine transferase subunit ALG14-like protein [Drosera capensis]